MPVCLKDRHLLYTVLRGQACPKKTRLGWALMINKIIDEVMSVLAIHPLLLSEPWAAPELWCWCPWKDN